MTQIYCSGWCVGLQFGMTQTKMFWMICGAVVQYDADKNVLGEMFKIRHRFYSKIPYPKHCKKVSTIRILKLHVRVLCIINYWNKALEWHDS